MRAWVLVVLALFAGLTYAQSCPRDNPNGPSFNSQKLTLTGKLVYHNDLRQWFGLRLGKPICGQTEIQLIGADEVADRLLQVHRGCRVSASGSLALSPTGYYSREISEAFESFESDPACSAKSPFPDYSNVKPDPRIRNYRVRIVLHYATAHKHIDVTAWSGGKLLAPWQAYAHYQLTGGFAFYGQCANGYSLRHLRGTPTAKPFRTDDEAWLDPETAASKGDQIVQMSFTCRR